MSMLSRAAAALESLVREVNRVLERDAPLLRPARAFRNRIARRMPWRAAGAGHRVASLTGEQVLQMVWAARPLLQTPVKLCKVCDLPEYSDREWLSAAIAIGVPHEGTYVTKKYWEYTHVLYGLRRLGCLRSDARVLSVGCGVEPPMYYLTSYVASVVGIDLFDDSVGDAVDNPAKYAPGFPHRLDRLKLIRMNGRKLEFSDSSFDVVFSLSSIEHFGGHEGSAEAMGEVGRVLKPGGVAAIATEFILTDASHPEFFNRADLDEYVIEASGLELVEPLDVTMCESLVRTYVHISETASPLFLRVHYGESPNNVPFTSVMLFLRKPAWN
jgi:SAM-dependent methyltransferase